MSVARTTELSVCIVVIKWKRTSRARDVRWTCKTAEYCAIYGDHTYRVEWALLRGRRSEQRNSFILHNTVGDCIPKSKGSRFYTPEKRREREQTGGLYHDAPQVGAIEGQTEIVEALLEFGSGVCIRGGIYGSAL
jgi:hypothetical protein